MVYFGAKDIGKCVYKLCNSLNIICYNTKYELFQK